MILLTDEEINLCGIKHVMPKEDAQAIAKAQLKKAVEWLQKDTAHKNREMWIGFSYKDWRALLKEIE